VRSLAWAVLRALLPYLAVALVVAIVTGRIVDRCAEAGHADELVELNNEMARTETTMRTELGNWIRRALVAESSKAVAEAMGASAREDTERWKLIARQNHAIAVTYRNRLVGETAARPDTGGGSVIPIELEDGNLSVGGEVRVGGVVIPEDAPIAVVLEVVLRELGLDVTILEDEHGLPRVLVSTDDPHVEAVTIESVVDRRSTGVDEEAGPSRTVWAAIGAGVVLGVQAILGN